MPNTFTFDLVGWRNRKGRFAHVLEPGVQQFLEDALASLSTRLVALAQSESPEGKTPANRDEVKFAHAWRTSTERVGGTTTVTLNNTSPYANFVLYPTKPHTITAHARVDGKLGYLRFSGRDGVMFAHSVHHPGTRGNDVLSRVSARVSPDAEQELQKVAARVASAFADVFSS